MRKNDIAKAIADGERIADSTEMINKVMAEIGKSLVAGEPVFIRGFGTFKVVMRKAKLGRNIKKQSFVHIPSRRQVKFLPAKELVRMVAGEEGVPTAMPEYRNEKIERELEINDWNF